MMSLHTRTQLLAAFASLLLCAVPPAQAQSAGAQQARVMVKLKSDSPLLLKQVASLDRRAQSRALALRQRLGLNVTQAREMNERVLALQADGLSSRQLADRLMREADVEYAAPDGIKKRAMVPNDPLFSQGPPVNGSSGGPVVGQWYLQVPTGTFVSAIDAPRAWDITQGSPSLVVAVLDTGVRFEHPDLLRASAGGKLLDGYNFISDPFISNTSGGTRSADASDPGDWVTQTEITAHSTECPSGTTPSDSSWHGTQVSGIIGALTNNGAGMAGVGWNVKVLPVRVLGKCGGLDSDIIAAMRWAAGLSVSGVPDNPNPARVINLSLGSVESCTDPTRAGPFYEAAIQEITARGAVIVASAGNSNGLAVSEPANCAGVIGVAGLRNIGTKVGYSDLGPEVSISAPAGNCASSSGACLYPILTTSNSGLQGPVASIYTDAFGTASLGTSFSAPLASGAAALMLSANSSLTPAQVRQTLMSSARAFPTSGAAAGTPVCTAPTTTAQNECYCTTSTCGAGMLDVGAAVAAVAPSNAGGGGGGGGALGWGWLLALAAAVWAAARSPRRAEGGSP